MCHLNSGPAPELSAHIPTTKRTTSRLTFTKKGVNSQLLHIKNNFCVEIIFFLKCVKFHKKGNVLKHAFCYSHSQSVHKWLVMSDSVKDKGFLENLVQAATLLYLLYLQFSEFLKNVC